MPAIIPIMDNNWSCIFRSLRSTTRVPPTLAHKYFLAAAYSAALIGWESLRGLSPSCRVCHSMHGLTLRTLTWIHARSHLSARSLTSSSMPGAHDFRGTWRWLSPSLPEGTGEGAGRPFVQLEPNPLMLPTSISWQLLSDHRRTIFHCHS